MRNSFLAPLPSQAFAFGNNEYQVLPSSDISSVLDSKLLWSLPRLFNDEETRGASSGINPLQSMVNPPTGYEDVPHLRLVQSERLLDQSKKHRQVLTPETTQLNERKRPLEARGDKSATEEAKTAPASGWKINKRKRVLCSARQFLPHAERSSGVTCESNVTGKRSQKIGDRITALQKLVSPYGKTDTASVLQEATLYIKLLQEQIQNLFQMLSSSYNSIRPLQVEENGRKQTDLRSRGLCLVAVSSIREATMETIVDDHSIHHCAY